MRSVIPARCALALLALFVVPVASASCPLLSASPAVNICSPSTGSVNSPFPVSASANDTAHPVVKMKVYLDFNSTAAYSVSNTNQLSTTLSAATGKHHITVKAWDSAGTTFSSGFYFNVGSTNSGRVTVSPSNVAFANQVIKTTSAPMSVTVTNGLSSSVTINYSGPSAPFAASGCKGVLVPAGGKCSIGITFTPATSGTTTGPITVTATSGLTVVATITIGLSGTGVIAPTCTLSTVNPSVTICVPTNGESVTSLFEVKAFTTDSHTVLVMKIYLDGTDLYSVNANQIDTTLFASAGTHRMTVKAWDGTANSPFSSTINVTVSGGACRTRGSQCIPSVPCCPGLTCVAASTRAFCE